MAQQLDPALPPREVLGALDAPVRRLVAVVKTLYAGSWDDCAEDIRRRRAGKPYLFKLALGLDDELDWLHRLQAYEAARGEPFTIDDRLDLGPDQDQHREDQ
jgi:hypothetical protein